MVRQEILDYLDFKINTFETFIPPTSTEIRLSGGEILSPDEVKCLMKIQKKANINYIDIFDNTPYVYFRYIKCSLLDSSRWNKEAADALKPAILEIFYLRKIWKPKKEKQEIFDKGIEEFQEKDREILRIVDQKDPDYNILYKIRNCFDLETLLKIKEKISKKK